MSKFFKIVICLAVLIPTISNAQELTPPLGLKFRMSKESFLKIMEGRSSRNKREWTISAGNSVQFEQVEIGGYYCDRFTAKFLNNQLFGVSLIFVDRTKEPLKEIYTNKYGQPSEESIYDVWKKADKEIRMSQITDNSGSASHIITSIDFTDLTLDSAYSKKSQELSEKKKNDF